MFLEVNIDSIIGPTHHYGGLSHGNKASMSSKNLRSNPKEAALQGLEKMQALSSLGVPQFVIPPQIRPSFSQVKKMGIIGIDEVIIESCRDVSSSLVSAVFSSSYMWMANAGHFTSCCDSMDRKSHFTPSNFSSQFHRVFETEDHKNQLKDLFNGTVIMHPAISPLFPDEGAANDTRLCSKDFKKGVSLFVYGKGRDEQSETQYPCRQSKEAYFELIQSHKLSLERIVFAKQHNKAIDHGVFHNDVISVGYKNIFLCHEYAFEDQDTVLNTLKETFNNVTNEIVNVHVIEDTCISIEDCVKSYLFNSQIVETPNDGLIMIAPKNCEEMPQIKDYINKVLLPQTTINKCLFLDLHESMRNGGGPACLRLRVLLNYDDYLKLSSRYMFTSKKYEELKKIIIDTYPEDISVDDFLNRDLLKKIAYSNSMILNFFEM
jgi:succinylarginine dihydrolase